MRSSGSCGSRALVAVALVMTACADAATVDRRTTRSISPPAPKVIVSMPTRAVDDRLDELERRAAELDQVAKGWEPKVLGEGEVAIRRVQNGMGSSSKGL